MILIDNIGILATMDEAGSEIHDAAIVIDGETIAWCGPKKGVPDLPISETLNAAQCVVMPGLIDCHTHLLFSGSRAEEFARRMNHESYEEIMKKGGGIATTVKACAQASDEELLRASHIRLDAMAAMGVTTIEAKSGYGLCEQEELRALKLMNKLNREHRMDIHATFLGAHIIPHDFKNKREDYVSLVVDMLEQIKAENLAKDCDVFCEEGAFTVLEAKKILSRAQDLGFGLRAHVQQLSLSGGVALLSELPIKSISHGDFLSEADIKVIARSKAVLEALPIAALFLRSKQIPPIDRLKQAGVPLAVATDFNPGSAMCNDLVLAARLAVTYFGLNVTDGLAAITKVAARSLSLGDRGTIAKGLLADVLITNCRSVNEFFYDWTKHPAHKTIKRGMVS